MVHLRKRNTRKKHSKCYSSLEMVRQVSFHPEVVFIGDEELLLLLLLLFFFSFPCGIGKGVEWTCKAQLNG